MSQPMHPLYQAAIDADLNFLMALVAEYGESAAGDMRYRTSEQTPEIQELGKAKVAADDAWLTFMGNQRTEAPHQKGRTI
jgi:hypothetical protein